MPCLNQQPWAPTALEAPNGTQSNAKVFHVRQTGEIFTEYEQFAARLRLLQSRQWSSNGKTGLNYEEASLEDRRAEALLKEVRLRPASHSRGLCTAGGPTVCFAAALGFVSN